MTRTAWGHALITLTDDATVLDAWFPAPALGEPGGAGELAAPAGLGALAVPDAVRGVRRELRLVSVDLDAPPADAPDGWLRLHLLSHRLCAPNSINLDGLFGVLTNVVWTSQGPCAVDGFELTRARLLARAELQAAQIFERQGVHLPTGELGAGQRDLLGDALAIVDHFGAEVQAAHVLD